MKHTNDSHTRIYFLIRTVFFALVLTFAGVFAVFMTKAYRLPHLTRATVAINKDPVLNEDSRMSYILQEEMTDATFILGSFPAFGYDAEYLSSITGNVAYNLADSANHFSNIKARFNFLVEFMSPDAIFLSVSPFDLFDETLKSEYLLPNGKTGGVYHGFDDTSRIPDKRTYDNVTKPQFSVDSKNALLLDQEHISERLQDLADMYRVCTAKGISFHVILSPYYTYTLSKAQTSAFRTFKEQLSNVCNYYDFTESIVCTDKRFFYNPYEFRTALGNNVLSVIAGGKTNYIPSDFYTYVQRGESADAPKRSAVEQIDLPVLLYHHVTEEPGYGDSVISVERFEEHLLALQEQGYQTVSLKQVEDYVLNGTNLPEKPILITFDDGYTSNFTLAYPLLKKYNMKAAIFVIGWAVGKDQYKDTPNAMIPHFDYKQAQEMMDSGLIEIQSHTYDLHQSESFEDSTSYRYSVLPLDRESINDYKLVLADDLRKFSIGLSENLGETVHALSYPHGLYAPLSEKFFAENGVLLTFSTEYRYKNTLVKGLPQTLRALCRFTVSESMDADAFIGMIEKLYEK